MSFYEVRGNSPSIVPIFVENIGNFSKLKIIGLNHRLLKDNWIRYSNRILNFHAFKIRPQYTAKIERYLNQDR